MSLIRSPKHFWLSFFTVLVVASLALAACNMPAGNAPVTSEPALIYTAAAQTVSAQLTQSANTIPATPTTAAGQAPTATQPALAPTNTQAPPPAPTHTPVPPTATSVPIPCDRAEFVKDVTIPDGTEMAPGTEFVKTWRLKNNGSCTWNSSYDLVFHDRNAMGGPAVIQLSDESVRPGETIDVSVTLKAPNAPGDYEGDWILRNDENVIFGIGAKADKFFWIKIKVTNAINFNFYSEAEDAEWNNATQGLDFGDPGDDSDGVAAYVTKVKLEDGNTYSKALATYPERIENGLILGIFAPYTVQADDHFRADIGFKSSCNEGKVKFQFGYWEGGSFEILKEWNKSCDGELRSVSFDLADLEGEEVEFVLAVHSAGDFKNDKAVWVDPRIQD
jgi:hypothetical protein